MIHCVIGKKFIEIQLCYRFFRNSFHIMTQCGNPLWSLNAERFYSKNKSEAVLYR